MKTDLIALSLLSLATILSPFAQADTAEQSVQFPTKALISGQAAAPEGEWILWYRRPAEKWVEALPLGNGRHGGDGFRRRAGRTRAIQPEHSLDGQASRVRAFGGRQVPA